MTQINTKLLKDLAVTEEKLAASAVTSGKIASNAIGASHLSSAAKQSVMQSKYVKSMTQVNGFSAGSSSTIAFSAQAHTSNQTGKIGGTDSAEGIVVATQYNRCNLRDSDTNKPIEDSLGRDVYGRITNSQLSLTGTTDWTGADDQVAGSGTSFQSEVAVNDILIGPDGLMYKVASIESDTALTLSANYAGTTVSDQTTQRNRITLSYYVDISGTETAHTMTGQTIDIQFPESFDLDSLPFSALVDSGVSWIDIGTTSGDHNHDSRYFTETELGATTETTGADRIGVDNTAVVGMTGTNVQDGLEQIARKGRYEAKTIATQDTIPNLTYTPRETASVVLLVDGIAQRNGTDYTVSSKAITWSYANAGFHLEAGDNVMVIYDSSDNA